jgi:hypothetical protein
MSRSIALLGDSVFDNKAYTRGRPDVAAHLREILPAGDRVTLLAVDGSTTTDIGRQLDRIPGHVTHVVLSVGGNDALEDADLLGLPVRSTAEALDRFAERVDPFEAAYGYVIEALRDTGRPATVCTIYGGNLGEEAHRARIALTTFNDVILRTALRLGVDVIDLRLVCADPGDFRQSHRAFGRGRREDRPCNRRRPRRGGRADAKVYGDRWLIGGADGSDFHQ